VLYVREQVNKLNRNNQYKANWTMLELHKIETKQKMNVHTKLER